MACEKYIGWMTEAALGELSPRREAELLLHAGACDACREAYNRAKAIAAAVDRGVESLVADEPSPQFRARLHVRIAQEPAPVCSTWVGWVAAAQDSRRLIAATASAVALAALLLFVIARLPKHSNPAPNVASRPSTSPVAVVPQATPQPRAETPPELRHARHVRHPVLPRSPDPQILVPPGQVEAVLQFADAIRAGRVDGGQLLTAQDRLTKPLKIDDLTIPPIEIQELQVNVPPGADENPGQS